MKRIEALNLIQLFEQLKNVMSIGFAYALMRNKKILDSERENLSKTIELTEKYSQFVKQMQSILEEFCIIDTQNPVILIDSVKLKEGKDRQEFIKAVLDLRELYSEEIANRRTLLREYQEFMGEEADIDFYKINESSLPTELSFHKLIMLSELIKYEERELETIELTVYSVLTYTNIFMKMIDIKALSSVNCEARNKSLFNFVQFRKKHKLLYSDPIIQRWVTYEKERKLLAESYSDTDIFGDVLIQHNQTSQDDQFVIKDMKAFEEALSTLNQKYEKELTDFYEFLNQKTSIDICKLNQEDLPEDTTLEDLQTLEIFIKN